MAGERRRAWYKKHVIGMIRITAADVTAPFLPSNPFYNARLGKFAIELSRRRNLLHNVSKQNRKGIAHGVKKAEYAYREKVIMFSLKNALRALDFPLSGRPAVRETLYRYAAVLPFISPGGRREVGLKNMLHGKRKKERLYAQTKIREILERMYSELDDIMGSRRRRQLLHYFSLFYDGGIHYRKTILAHHRDA